MQQIVADVLDIIADHMDADIEDYSGATNDDFMRVSDCADPEIASNNCENLSAYIREWCRHDGIKTSRVRIVFGDDCYHVANLVGDVVIDATIRQFGEEFEFPYVAPLEQWVDDLTVAAQNKYGYTYVRHEIMS